MKGEPTHGPDSPVVDQSPQVEGPGLMTPLFAHHPHEVGAHAEARRAPPTKELFPLDHRRRDGLLGHDVLARRQARGDGCRHGGDGKDQIEDVNARVQEGGVQALVPHSRVAQVAFRG